MPEALKLCRKLVVGYHANQTFAHSTEETSKEGDSYQ